MMKSVQMTKFNYSLLPEPPDGFIGYQVVQHSARWQAVWLLHRQYDYKENVRTIYCFINKKGEVYAPLHCKPSNTKVCDLHQLYKQNPYTTIKRKETGVILKYLR